MTIEKLEKRVKALEDQDGPSTVNTWLDLMIAVKEDREIVLGPDMESLLAQIKKDKKDEKEG
jgi:hypothetical protein